MLQAITDRPNVAGTPRPTDWEAGIRAMREIAIGNAEYPDAAVYFDKKLGLADRCMTNAFYQAYEHTSHGPTLQWSYKPCNTAGHPLCAWQHAKRDLGKQWEGFDVGYGSGPLAIFLFDSGVGIPRPDFRELVTKLMRCRPLRPLVTVKIGYITQRPDRYIFCLLVRGRDRRFIGRAYREWERICDTSKLASVRAFAHQSSVTLHKVRSGKSALVAAMELRIEAEQAIPCMVSSGEMTPETGLHYFMEERRSRGNRVVRGPGWHAARATGPRTMSMFAYRYDELDQNRARHWEDCALCTGSTCRQRPAEGIRLIDYQTIERLVAKGHLIRDDHRSPLLLNPELRAPPRQPPGHPFNFGLKYAERGDIVGKLVRIGRDRAETRGHSVKGRIYFE